MAKRKKATKKKTRRKKSSAAKSPARRKSAPKKRTAPRRKKSSRRKSSRKKSSAKSQPRRTPKLAVKLTATSMGSVANKPGQSLWKISAGGASSTGKLQLPPIIAPNKTAALVAARRLLRSSV